MPAIQPTFVSGRRFFQHMTGFDVIRDITSRFGLPMPSVKIDPNIRKQGWRGVYEDGSVTLSDPEDLENARHEGLHYVSDKLKGNPLAMFRCLDPSCKRHVETVIG